MAISFNDLIGIHESAIALRTKRTAILTNNLVNADTPNYLARDFNFGELLQKIESEKNGLNLEMTGDVSIKLSVSNESHYNLDDLVSNDNLKYRVPLSPSQDGNTVEPSIEYVKFSENALAYQAGLEFISDRFSSVTKALKGDS